MCLPFGGIEGSDPMIRPTGGRGVWGSGKSFQNQGGVQGGGALHLHRGRHMGKQCTETHSCFLF